MRIVLLAFGLFVIAIVGVAMLQSGLITGGDDITNVNESWTPNAGSVTQLDDSELDNAYYDNETTVYNTSGTDAVEMTEGTDYEWIETNGTVKALTGGGLDGASEATITYSYQLTTDEEERIAGMLAQIPRVVGVALPVLALLFLLLFLGRGM